MIYSAQTVDGKGPLVEADTLDELIAGLADTPGGSMIRFRMAGVEVEVEFSELESAAARTVTMTGNIGEVTKA